MGLAKTTAAVYLLALSALSSAEVTTTSAGTDTSTRAIHSITTTTTTTSRTITHTSATSPGGKTRTSHDPVPGVTHIPDAAIILSILSAPHSANRGHGGPDSSEPLFIDTTRPHLARSCASASLFNLTSGRLSPHGTDTYLSTNKDVVFQPLTTTKVPAALQGKMDIGGTFSVEEGMLRWYNPRFYGGRARYCRDVGTGMVNFIFHVGKTWPVGCEEVDVRVFREGECRDGEVVGGMMIGEVEEGKEEVRTTGSVMETGAPAGWDEL